MKLEYSPATIKAEVKQNKAKIYIEQEVDDKWIHFL